jgi:hypothetical protein
MLVLGMFPTALGQDPWDSIAEMIGWRAAAIAPDSVATLSMELLKGGGGATSCIA